MNLEEIGEVEADEKSQEVDFRDEVMHAGKSDLWFLEQSEWMVEQEWQQMKSEYCEEAGEISSHGDKQAVWY